MRKNKRAEFESLVLTKDEIALFKKVRKNGIVEMSLDDAYHVSRFGLIERADSVAEQRANPGYGPYRISDFGRHYIRYQKDIGRDRLVTRTLAIVGAVTGIAALAIELVQLLL